MAQSDSPGGRLRIGWREWLALPALGIDAIKAKADTGARTSALHVDHQEEFQRDGERWVRFKVVPASRRRKLPLVCEARVVDERYVTDSSGGRARRLFIMTRVRLGPHEWDIEMNLTNRGAMLFPMLLGRTAMAGRVELDPAQSYLLGRPRRRVRQAKAT